MSTELSSLLSMDVRHAKISPEVLEMMGKKAANMFLDDGLALNEGVVKVASEHPDITHEQIKRVCEFANTATYLAKHDKNKVAGATSSYPQFELADPARIIQDMSDGARPTTVSPVDVEYGRQPYKTKEKVSSVRFDLLEGLFKGAAAPDHDFSRETAFQEVWNAKTSLVDLKSSLVSSGEQFDLMFKEAAEQYYDDVKRHLLDGGDFSEVVALARATGASKEKVAEVMQPVVLRLLKEKVATPQKLTTDMKGIEKQAHRVVNEEHPLFFNFGALVTADQEIEKIAVGLKEIEPELEKVEKFIRDNFSIEQRVSH